jgi:nucleoside-diphosphate-sugar epimerase
MKCFMTGVTGFIGSNLARQLAADGHTVNAIIRDTVPQDWKDIPGLQLYQGDLQNMEALKGAMKGCDVAFHLAGFARPWSKDPGDFYRINVEGAVNVFNAALDSGIKKVVFTSSAATMSPSVNGEPANEDTVRTIPFFNAYESTKAEAETKAREFSGKGLPVVIVNPSRVYGPGPINPSNSVTRVIAGYRNGSWRINPGNGKMTGNYVYIDDVVHGHVLAAQKGRAGERYILGGENITFDEFFHILEKVTGVKRQLIRLQVPVMAFAAKFLEWQNHITGIPPAITADFVKKYMVHWSLSSEKAINELGYRITPFETGVKETIEWLGGIKQAT